MTFARDHELKLGGWVPLNGWAEDFPKAPGILKEYPEFKAAPSPDMAVMTRLNIEQSDATLLLVPPRVKSPGSLAAQALCRDLDRPCLLTHGHSLQEILGWLDDLQQKRRKGLWLNVGGPRASEYSRGEGRAYRLLSAIFTAP